MLAEALFLMHIQAFLPLIHSSTVVRFNVDVLHGGFSDNWNEVIWLFALNAVS